MINAIGPIYCSGGTEVGTKIPLTVVRTEKWAPRTPQGEGYSGINLRAGEVVDGISLETTDGEGVCAILKNRRIEPCNKLGTTHMQTLAMTSIHIHR
jgi:hypothetical protein